MNTKARELLRAAKQKKLENPIYVPQYEIKQDEQLEDTENTSKEGIKVSDTSDNSNSPNKITNKINLFSKKADQPKILINNKHREEQKKIVIPEIIQKEYEAEEPVSTSPLKELKVKDPTSNDRLMKRMISAKTQKQFGMKQPSKVMTIASDLESKLKIGNERKKFFIDDNDIQKIEIKNTPKPIEEGIHSNKDVDQIILEKPVVRNRKMTKIGFKL
jgi:hypothetical protein